MTRYERLLYRTEIFTLQHSVAHVCNWRSSTLINEHVDAISHRQVEYSRHRHSLLVWIVGCIRELAPVEDWIRSVGVVYSQIGGETSAVARTVLKNNVALYTPIARSADNVLVTD